LLVIVAPDQTGAVDDVACFEFTPAAVGIDRAHFFVTELQLFVEIGIRTAWTRSMFDPAGVRRKRTPNSPDHRAKPRAKPRCQRRRGPLQAGDDKKRK
jgi:hypothetical protein